MGTTYQQGGIEALLKVNYGTNTSILEDHATAIVELLTKQPPRTIGEAMLQNTGIDRHRMQLQPGKGIYETTQVPLLKDRAYTG